jgi:phosphoglycolate phosphatase
MRGTDRVFSLLLFDLDGVLADSRVAIARSMNHALVAVGLTPAPEASLHPLIGPPLHAAFEELLAARGADVSLADACVAHYRERYATACVQETLPMAGVPEAVAALMPRVPLAVVTSKPVEFARPILATLGLAESFRAVIGPTLSARSEPKEVTLGRALAVFEERPAAIVGDRHHDVEAGRAHGLYTVGVTWGIGSEAELRAAGASHIVHRPDELVALLG